MRRKYGSKSGSRATQEAEFNLGYLYRTIENHIDAFAAEAGDSFALDYIADRVGQLLRLKAEKVRAQLGAAELLLEMRQNGTAAGRGAGDYSGGAARPALSVGALDGGTLRRKRHLSKKALKAISIAQKARWAKYHAGKGPTAAEKRERARLAKRESRARARKGVGQGSLTKAQRARGARALKSYWAMMTPEQRSAEMIRRQAVAAAKKKVVEAA